MHKIHMNHIDSMNGKLLNSPVLCVRTLSEPTVGDAEREKRYPCICAI